MLSRRLLRIKVIKALYAHFKSESESLDVSEKNLTASADKTYDLYFQMLWLPVEVMRYADRRIDIARRKKLPTHEDLNPNTKFIDNRLIRQMEQSDKLTSYLDRTGLGWARYPELVKSLYKSMLDSDFYKAYMDSPKDSWAEDVKFVEDFYVNLVENNEQVEEVVEEQSIQWADDVDFALILAVRTVSLSREGQADLPILPKYKNDDDRRFLTDLFRKTVLNYDEYLGYVEQLTQNWDVERIAFMDNIIMVAAIAELVGFDSIPVKVTLDEYIEIAKYYSTSGSSHFINGVLDKAVEMLTEKGLIRKAGRGLL